MSKTRLTELKLKSLKEHSKATVLSDGGGLYIKVYPNGKMQWLLRKTSCGRAHQVYLGHYPDISLKQARELARNEATRYSDGRAGRAPVNAMTLAQLYGDFIASREFRPTSVRAYNYLFSLMEPLHDRMVDTIAPIEVKTLANSIGRAVSKRVARDAIGLLAQLERLACALDLCETPRLQSIIMTLPQPEKVTHNRYVTADKLPALFESAHSKGCSQAQMDRLLFLLFTLNRTNELRNCLWTWINLDTRVITFPASAMKTNREHRVPISTQLQTLLERMYQPGQSYVMPGRSSTGARSPLLYRTLFKRLGIYEQITPHGVRAMARTWFADTGRDFAAAEMCLAHRVENATQTSYQHSDYLEQRREIMQAWCDYVCDCARTWYPDL